jgi:GNAT superfamily N-acetyltransferase
MLNGQIGLTIEPMTVDELQVLEEWAAIEDWNPGYGDLNVLYKIEPNAFLALHLDGRFIGGASIVSYGGCFGFVGLFIVHRDFRSQGYGTYLWEHLNATLKARLKPGAAMGLDGVIAMMPYYGRQGYKLSYRHIRFQGTPLGAPSPYLARLSDLPFDQIDHYDQAHFKAKRSAFLKAWTQKEGAIALGYIDHGILSGMIIARPARLGLRVGPFFADTPTIAKNLLLGLSDQAPGVLLQIDCPEVNVDAMTLFKEHGFVEVFVCGRMYCGSMPLLPVRSIYGTTTLEFG